MCMYDLPSPISDDAAEELQHLMHNEFAMDISMEEVRDLGTMLVRIFSTLQSATHDSFNPSCEEL